MSHNIASEDSPQQAEPPAKLDANALVLSPDEQTEVAAKLKIAHEKKDLADAAFKTGDIKSALRSYHESLLYLHGIDKSALKTMGISPSPKSAVDQAASAKAEKTEVDFILEKIYANMSACHIKLENWRRAVDTADKAIAKNPANSKALFRKGKALGELGFFEKAEVALLEARTVAPEAATVDAELARQRAADRERQKTHDQKMRGWLSREKKPENGA